MDFCRCQAYFFLHGGKKYCLYSNLDKKLIRFSENNAPANSHVYGAAEIHQFVESPNGAYGIGNKKVFRFRKKGSAWYPELIFTDTSQNNMGHVIVDPLWKSCDSGS